MFSFLLVLIFGIIILIFLPQIANQVRNAFPSKEQKEKLEAEEKARQEKGAIANTVDFFLGEGTIADQQKAFDEAYNKLIFGKTTKQLQQEKFEKSASEAIGSPVTFPTKSTVVISPDGIVSSDMSPRFKLTQKEIDIIRNKFNTQPTEMINTLNKARSRKN